MLLMYIVCCFSHCVLFLPLCVVSPIVRCFSHCVLVLPLCTDALYVVIWIIKNDLKIFVSKVAGFATSH